MSLRSNGVSEAGDAGSRSRGPTSSFASAGPPANWRKGRSQDITAAPLLAASIFLDILNVFLFFLQIFSRRE
jgi:hypothetical protein